MKKIFLLTITKVQKRLKKEIEGKRLEKACFIIESTLYEPMIVELREEEEEQQYSNESEQNHNQNQREREDCLRLEVVVRKKTSTMMWI